MPKWIANLIGKYIKGKIKLEDGMDTTKWYKSRRMWNGVVIVVIGAYETAALQFGLPSIPPFVYSILGALGLYLNKTSKTVIQ